MSAKKQPQKSRRNFFKSIGSIGIGAAATGSILSFESCSSNDPESTEKIKLLGQNNQLVEVDASQIKSDKIILDKEYLHERGRIGLPNKRFVMVIDLSRCKDERKCVQKCQGAHQLKPDQFHINVLEIHDEDSRSTYYMPKPCQHCDNPPCVSVCPVDATFKRQDGLVLIDNERCIGCRFCIAACPYSARSFNWTEPKDAEKYADVEYDLELNVPQKKGTVTKCAFSADRLRQGKLPYCVTACPNGVYYFGDENENLVTNGTTRETVELSELLQDNAAYTLMPELGTKPRVYYLPAKKNNS